MTARKRSRSNKKASTGRVTPKGTKPVGSSSRSSSASAKAADLPRPVTDQRLKHQSADYGAHSASRSGRRGGR